MIKTMTIDGLERANEDEKIAPFIKDIIRILLSSVNDWPSSNIKSLNEFNIEVSRFLKNDVVKKNIEEKLLDINYTKNAWEAEALTNLVDIFIFDFENKSLSEIDVELVLYVENLADPPSGLRLF